MRRPVLVVVLGLLLLLVSAPILGLLFFMPVSSRVEAGPRAPVEAPVGSPGATREGERAVERVREGVARLLGVPASSLEVVEVAERDWADGCLGLAEPGEFCTQAIVPGYRIVLRGLASDHYVVRTSGDGSAFRLEGEGQQSSPTAQEATDLVRFALAQRINDPSLAVVSYEERDWSNGCLGLPSPAACTEAIVPGYRVVMQAAGDEYVARTDRDGSFYRLESSPVRVPASPDFARGGFLEGGCLQVALFRSGAGVVFGCGEAPTRFELTNAPDLAYLERLLSYQAVAEQDPDEARLVIRGSGEHKAGPNELRAAAEWGQLVAQAAFAGRRGASWGLAIAWQDDSATPCANVHLERYGFAFTSRCTPETNLDGVVLGEQQLATLYGWLDRYASFEERASSGESFLAFSGGGSEQADEATRKQIRDWVESLHPDR